MVCCIVLQVLQKMTDKLNQTTASNRKKQLLTFALTLFLFGLHLMPAWAQTPQQAYLVQEGDWLSSIAERAYGNPHLYHRIIDGTNNKAAVDESFAPLNRPNQLEVGQKVWIPSPPGGTNLASVPKTDCEIRLWYNYQVVAIGLINEKWQQDGLELETRARRAYELRHEARVNARFMMQDQAAVKALQERDMAKYGNPDGPTFEYLLQNNTDNGLSVAEAYQSIIDSSSRTDQRFNADCQ